MLALNKSDDPLAEADSANPTASHDLPTQIEEDPAKGIDAVQPNQDPENSNDLANVPVVITYAGAANGQISASGIVANVVETDGACTFVFTSSAGKTASYTSEPTPGASSTSCVSANIAQDQLSSGEWSVILKYQSVKSKGESQSASFEIS